MNQSKIEGCGLCWSWKRKCERTDTGCCRRCLLELRERVVDNQSYIKEAALLDNLAIHQQLFNHTPTNSFLSLNTIVGNSNTLSLYITPSSGPVVEFSQLISGIYTTDNKVIIDGLDGLARRFSANLKDKEAGSHLISISALAGGFMHLLCSVDGVKEAVNTFRNGIEVENEYTTYNIAAHFKYIVLCRLQELVGQVLSALRSEHQGLESPGWRSGAHAAGVILRREIEYFKNGIKNGRLRKHIPDGLRSLLLDWFASSERELDDRLRLGCAQFKSWRVSSVKGSMKSLRRHGETLNMHMQLRLNYQMQHERPPAYLIPSPYTSIGHGMHTLAPDPFSPHQISAIRNGYQPFAFTESITMTPAGYMGKLPEDFQTPFPPVMDNAIGFTKSEFRQLVNKQAAINPTIDPRLLLLRDVSMVTIQTIYEAQN